MSKILFIGDVVGKGGRRILREVLPQWREKYQPDAVIVNVENLAHGKGVTPTTLGELDDLNIDCYTSGNHIFKKGELSSASFEKYDKLIRPANYPSNMPGHGYYRFSKEIKPILASPLENGRNTAVAPSFSKEGEGGVNNPGQQFLVINLNGQVFMDHQFEGIIENPFLTLDKLLLDQGQKGDIIIVDFHAEATSEKIALGYHVDGKVAAVLGTHTHVPTADDRVLSNGTAYITDVGMTGALNGILGVKKESALKKFLDANAKFKYEIEEEGILQINGVLIEVESEKLKVKSITKLYQEI